MKHFTLTLAATGLLLSTTAMSKTIIDDSFADSDRSNGADALDSNWWTTSTSSAIEVSEGSLGLVSGGSGRGIRTTFEPQTLAVDQSVKASFTFTTPQTLGMNRDSAFRIGMYDKAGRAELEADLSASSKEPNEIYNGLPGYMIDFDINLDDPSKANINIRKHNDATTGRLLGTTKGYKMLGGGGNAYNFTADQMYTGTMTIQKVADGVQISGSLSQDGKELSQFSVLDKDSNTNNIGMLAFHTNSKTFGSSKKKDTPDNGVDFQNVKIELLP